MIHFVEASREHYTAIVLGTLTAELRPGDNPYRVGDTLVLQERNNGKLTGRCIETVITSVYHGEYVREGYILIHFQIIFPDSGPKIPIKTYMELLKKYNECQSELEELRSEGK